MKGEGRLGPASPAAPSPAPSPVPWPAPPRRPLAAASAPEVGARGAPRGHRLTTPPRRQRQAARATPAGYGQHAGYRHFSCRHRRKCRCGQRSGLVRGKSAACPPFRSRPGQRGWDPWQVAPSALVADALVTEAGRRSGASGSPPPASRPPLLPAPGPPQTAKPRAMPIPAPVGQLRGHRRHQGGRPVAEPWLGESPVDGAWWRVAAAVAAGRGGAAVLRETPPLLRQRSACWCAACVHSAAASAAHASWRSPCRTAAWARRGVPTRDLGPRARPAQPHRHHPRLPAKAARSQSATARPRAPPGAPPPGGAWPAVRREPRLAPV